jgi:hypothetical protein
MSSDDGGLRRGALVQALCAVAAAGLLAATFAAQPAAAIVTHLRNGVTVGYEPISAGGLLQGNGPAGAQPLARGFSLIASKGNVKYHGGPVMTSNDNYAFYWDPPGAPAYQAEYQSGINEYFEDLAHDSGGNQNTDSVAVQYGDSGGEFANYDSHFAGVILDTDPYPANGCAAAPICLTAEQLEAELAGYTAAHGLPNDLAHEYFLLTPPGVEDCLEATECTPETSHPFFCAFHGSIATARGPLIWSNLPDLAEIRGCEDGEFPNKRASDGEIQMLTHEHLESVTDPETNAWFTGEIGEIADKCRTGEDASEFGAALGRTADNTRFNQVVDGREYFYQQEWSNEEERCVQRSALELPAIAKLSPKSGPAAGGTTVKIKGTEFKEVTAVQFGGVNTPFTVLSPILLTAVAPPGTSGEAGVSVTNAVGTSHVTIQNHFKYGSPTITGLSPSSGPLAGGIAVTIAGSGFAPGSATVFDFGKVAATGVSCASTSSCTVTAPSSSAAGVVQVTAVAGGKRSRVGPQAEFTYG